MNVGRRKEIVYLVREELASANIISVYCNKRPEGTLEAEKLSSLSNVIKRSSTFPSNTYIFSNRMVGRQQNLWGDNQTDVRQQHYRRRRGSAWR